MRLFSLPDFRRLWFIGFTLSVVRWLEMLALALFAYKLTGSAFVGAMSPFFGSMSPFFGSNRP